MVFNIDDSGMDETAELAASSLRGTREAADALTPAEKRELTRKQRQDPSVIESGITGQNDLGYPGGAFRRGKRRTLTEFESDFYSGDA